jgi:hypothetical protein
VEGNAILIRFMTASVIAGPMRSSPLRTGEGTGHRATAAKTCREMEGGGKKGHEKQGFWQAKGVPAGIIFNFAFLLFLRWDPFNRVFTRVF